MPNGKHTSRSGRGYSGARNHTRTTRGSGSSYIEGGLATGKEAANAALDALSISNGIRSRAVTLVAVRGAFVGFDGLRSVGAGVTHARGLAINIASIACERAAHGGSESRNSRSRGSTGYGSAILGKGECANGESEDSEILHCGCFVWLV